MRCMSRRVESSAAKRRTGSVAATALIALLVAYAALPLCSAAFICTMPCCEQSSDPMEDPGGMPSPACDGTASECAVAGVVPADTGAVLVLLGQTLHASPIAAPHAFSDVARPAAHTMVAQPRSTSLRLYVINDVFLI